MDVPPLALHSSRENPTEGKEQLGIGKITMPAERYDNISNLFTHRLWSAGNTKFCSASSGFPWLSIPCSYRHQV